MHLRRFCASERTTQYDQELLAQYQTQFFTDEADFTPAALGKPKKNKKKRAKCPWAITGQRHAAMSHIEALDKMLLLSIGEGLVAFQCGDKSDEEIVKTMLETRRLAPTLILHADEGSPAYSMNWFLVYSSDLRFIPVHDIYHR